MLASYYIKQIFPEYEVFRLEENLNYLITNGVDELEVSAIEFVSADSTAYSPKFVKIFCEKGAKAAKSWLKREKCKKLDLWRVLNGN